MKRFIIFAVSAVVALLGSATDRFYIEDFVINPGETTTVSIMLENDVVYTAFQTDIYLPEGLTVEQEDGDYIFDLTSRKSRDHIISSQLQADGAIRVMSYSNTIKPFSGTSGALVTFNVIAAEDFSGPVTIELKKNLFTTTEGRELILANEICTVTTASTLQRGDVNEDGIVNISDVIDLIDYLLDVEVPSFNFANADLNDSGSINIGDLTDLIDLLLN